MNYKKNPKGEIKTTYTYNYVTYHSPKKKIKNKKVGDFFTGDKYDRPTRPSFINTYN